ncbi:MAG: TonB-dependent receptor [Mariniphaga sp.]|nr:TonB-dependent receptor [Mariniphaga sp.]
MEKNVTCKFLPPRKKPATVRRFVSLLLILILATVFSAQAQQQKTLTGNVTDNSGEALVGVSVVVAGTVIGIPTDINGEFSIDVPTNATSLIFSFIGMVTQVVEIGDQSIFSIILEAESVGLEEVIAIGYGVEKKATITGSVTAVQGDDLKKSPAINVTNNLVGRLPGLIAVNRSGEPGYDGSTLLIRGSNTLNNSSPLVVIDGVTGRNMDRLDPADIESISVLKDASAAIYGAQAANGVILITTKRGKLGKPTITVNLNQGFNQPTRIPEMADAATYAQTINEINLYRDRDLPYSADDIQKYKDGSAPWTHPNTDWFDETFKTWSPQQYGNVSITGGTQAMRYYVSMGANFQDGIYENSATYYNQYDFRSNLDGQVSENIHFAIDLSGRQENRHYPTRGAGDIFRMLQRGKPNLPAYWPDGTPGPDIEYGDNPVVVTTDETGYDNDDRYIFESNLKLNITIPWVEGLSVTANAAFDKEFRTRKLFQKGWYLYSWDFETYGADGLPSLIKGLRGFGDPRLRQESRQIQNITVNGLLNYERTFADIHAVKVLLGVERFQGDNANFWAYRRYFPTDIVDQLFAGSDLEKDNSGSASDYARLNYFGRLNYRLNDKYLAEFVFRYDGSYIFPKESRFGFFPGISLGWRISEENFWKENLGFIENFKLRASWGQTGNDRIDPYQYLSSYAFGGNTYIFGSTESKVLVESRIPNTEITWEVATQINVGFDGQTLDGKLYFEADYFHNTRTDILWWRNASVPNTTGLSLPRENLGEVVNRGFEYLVTYRDRVGDLSYSVSLNGGYQKNEIKFWDETPGIPEYQQSTGHPMNTNLYYQAIGIFNDQAEVDAYPHWPGARAGDIIFEDVNDDGAIDGLDRVREYKNNIPRFQGGLNIQLGYKQFDLTVLFQGSAGAVQYYSTESGEIGNFLVYDADGRWTPDNTNADKPRAKNRSEEYWANNDNTYFLRSTDYIRLKNLEFGYNFSSSLCNRLGVKGLRIYFSGINLATIDKFKVYDPETSNNAGTNYPQNRTINGGVTLTF